MGRDTAFGRERQARLKQEYAAAYQGIAPGVWQPAWLLAEQLAGLPPATLAEGRCDPRHFTFRGGGVGAAPWGDAPAAGRRAERVAVSAAGDLEGGVAFGGHAADMAVPPLVAASIQRRGHAAAHQVAHLLAAASQVDTAQIRRPMARDEVGQ